MDEIEKDPTIKRLTEDIARRRTKSNEIGQKLIKLEEQSIQEAKTMRQQHERARTELERKQANERAMHDRQYKAKKDALQSERGQGERIIAREENELETARQRFETKREQELREQELREQKKAA